MRLRIDREGNVIVRGTFKTLKCAHPQTLNKTQ